MFKKKEKLTTVFAFHTTADAMHAEAVLKKSSVPGKIIPIPRSMSAGCGLAWGMPPECRPEAERVLKAEMISPEQIAELMLYF